MYAGAVARRQWITFGDICKRAASVRYEGETFFNNFDEFEIRKKSVFFQLAEVHLSVFLCSTIAMEARFNLL
jgi:hypothetical protein